MPAALPDGVPVPTDGSIPDDASAEFAGNAAAGRPFGVYVHVPFCTTRCGYCDFNTYTATELGPGVSRATYADQVVAELRLARRVLGDVHRPVAYRLLRRRDADPAAVGGPGQDPAHHR